MIFNQETIQKILGIAEKTYIKPEEMADPIFKFSEFKPLELANQTEIEKIKGKFPSYSDFNFVSMWSSNMGG